MGYYFRLAARVLLYAPSDRQDSTYIGWSKEMASNENVTMRFHDKFRSTMVWGVITMTARTPTPPPYCAGKGHWAVLPEQPFEIPFARRVGRRFVLQDDNARAHSARIVNAHLQQHNIYRMSWPAMTPDLPSIEHVWNMIWKEGRTCFIYRRTQHIFYLRLYGVRHMVRNHSDRERKPAAATYATLFD